MGWTNIELSKISAFHTALLCLIAFIIFPFMPYAIQSVYFTFGFILLILGIFAYKLTQLHVGKQMVLSLKKYVFFAGEEIEGTVILNLNKEKKARGLYLLFYGLLPSADVSPTVFEKKRLLQPARTYKRGQAFRFSIPMPDPDKVKHIIVANSRNPPVWFIKAYLDLPNEIDISRSVAVKIAKGKKGKDD